MSDEVRRVRVVAALIERGDEVLVSRRLSTGERPNKWEFPGGKVEVGETDRQALAREIREELGISCGVGELFGRLTHRYPDLLVDLLLYRVALFSGEPKALGSAELRWVRKPTLAALDFLAADVTFIQKLLDETEDDDAAN